ncbi:FAD-dependent oxidoreductase [Marinivivus vitaminiproducens]|uniref:FAD-dependent oxidoreductase n=1 Tax=Marinivivus vitaminiproducens TaxID=3035935 RepID=UPI00279F4230|nr:FAD-dependent oxidoreductase [Geminicoccaceae bacterium SCSIO 64248]
MRRIKTRVCIAGGGPAGMMLGWLLARANIEVVVLEKHGDFLRDFRGDTIHPSTLEIMAELDVIEGLLALPHQKAPVLSAMIGDLKIPVADFRSLPTRCGYIAFMPQWDFLDFIADQARPYPGFALMQSAEVTGLVVEDGRVRGCEARTTDGRLEVRADLVVGADGRRSTVRAEAGLQVEEKGAPMDVLWFALPRGPDDPEEALGRFIAGRILILINRGEQWQCGLVIAKGTFDAVRSRGLERFRRDLAGLLPFAKEQAEAITDWDQVKLLSVQVDRLRTWHRAGLLCIGDAAHAMSPVGGVGINLAIQDAVAAANLLVGPLRSGAVGDSDLARVQKRRAFPAHVTQAMQIAVQRRVIGGVLGSDEPLRPPLPLRLLARFPLLRRIPARLVGIGVRPEHPDPVFRA